MIDGRVLLGLWLAAVGASLATLDRDPISRTDTSTREVSAMATSAARSEVTPDIVTQDGSAGTRIHRSSDGLFYIDGAVNGTPVRFLVDSGASIIVLAPADATRAGIDPGRQGQTATMRTSGGLTSMAWAKAGRVSVAGLELHDAKVAIPDSGLQISLLGQSALSQLGPVTFDGDVLTIAGKR